MKLQKILNKMGNDIRLPATSKKEQEEKSELEIDIKRQLLHEIDETSNKLSKLKAKIEQIDDNKKSLSNDVAYYTALVKDLTKSLEIIEQERQNAALVHENYVEKSKQCLDSLEPSNVAAEQDDEQYTAQAISMLESQVKDLSDQVEKHEALIESHIARVNST